MVLYTAVIQQKKREYRKPISLRYSRYLYGRNLFHELEGAVTKGGMFVTALQLPNAFEIKALERILLFHLILREHLAFPVFA